jgi:hypothetical protein
MGGIRKAKGKRQKAEGRRQKAKAMRDLNIGLVGYGFMGENPFECVSAGAAVLRICRGGRC